jgi:hypothetical protein
LPVKIFLRTIAGKLTPVLLLPQHRHFIENGQLTEGVSIRVDSYMKLVTGKMTMITLCQFSLMNGLSLVVDEDKTISLEFDFER